MPDAAEVEDRLLATLADALQAERAKLPRLLRRIDRLRSLLATRRQVLLRCRLELAHARQAASADTPDGAGPRGA